MGKHVIRNAAPWLTAVLMWPVVIAAAGQTAPPPAPQTEGPTQQGAFVLPEVVVLRDRDEGPAALLVREVSRADMQAYNAHTAAEALTPVPGVNVQWGGSSGDTRIWIRGFRDRDSLVLFDGIPIASGFEGTIDLSEIPTEHIGEIRVIKSAPSVIYGTNGMGGVVDIVPRAGSQARSFGGGVELGSTGRSILRASAGGSSGGLDHLLSVSRDRGEDYSLADGYPGQLNQPKGDRLNSDFRRDNLFLSLRARSTPIGQTSFFYNLSDAEKGLPPTAGVEEPDFQRLTQSRRQTVGFSNRFTGLPLAVKLYYNNYDSDLTTYTDSTYRVIDEVERARDYSLGGQLYSTLDVDANQRLVLHGSGQKDVYQGEGELENGNRADILTWTAAVEHQLRFADRLSLATGGIFSLFDQTRLDRSSSAFSPQIAAGWQLNRQLALHASVAKRTRFPKLRELYRRRFGNPDLEAQKAVNHEVGLRYAHRAGHVSDITWFYSDVDGVIERPNRNSLYLNLEPVVIKGVEMATAGWLSSPLYARLSYTYIAAEESLPGGGHRQLRSRPRHTAQTELRYRLPRAVTASFTGMYVSGLYDLDDAGRHTELDRFFVGNLKLSRQFAAQLAGYLAVSNITDEDYQHRLGDPREGASLRLGAELSL